MPQYFKNTMDSNMMPVLLEITYVISFRSCIFAYCLHFIAFRFMLLVLFGVNGYGGALFDTGLRHKAFIPKRGAVLRDGAGAKRQH